MKVAGIVCVAWAAGAFSILALFRATNRPTPASPSRVGQAAARTDEAPHPSVPAAVDEYSAAFVALADLTARRLGLRLDQAYREATIARFRQQIDAYSPTWEGEA